MDAERLCRNGHPRSRRYVKPSGGTDCRDCRTDRQHYQNRTLPVDLDPAMVAERAAWQQAWAAGVAAAIVVLRLTEGFDGRERGWQTLGEYLPLERMPTPLMQRGRAAA